MGVIFKKDQPNKAADLKKELENLKQSLTEMQAHNIALEQQLTDAQLALVEIYESVVE